jgi:hypothetical protein
LITAWGYFPRRPENDAWFGWFFDAAPPEAGPATNARQSSGNCPYRAAKRQSRVGSHQALFTAALISPLLKNGNGGIACLKPSEKMAFTKRK